MTENYQEMKEYIVEYVVLEHRIVRVEALTPEAASDEVKGYHAQLNSDMLTEAVLITKCEEDK